MLCRAHGADLCYTPMLHSRLFVNDAKYRERNFPLDQDCSQDRPLFVQFCGDDPAVLLAAARLVEHRCDAIDLNLGCPQGIARRGHYGAFLLEEQGLLERIVGTLSGAGLAVPITCKVRVLPTVEATVRLAQALERAGASVLAVHGRTKEQKKQFTGAVDWAAIAAIKRAVRVPVIANGGVGTYACVQACLAATGCDAVMSSEAVLENPSLFEPRPGCPRCRPSVGTAVPSPPPPPPPPPPDARAVAHQRIAQVRLCLEYLALCQSHAPAPVACVKPHVFKFLMAHFHDHTDLRDLLAAARGPAMVAQIRDIVGTLAQRYGVAPGFPVRKLEDVVATMVRRKDRGNKGARKRKRKERRAVQRLLKTQADRARARNTVVGADLGSVADSANAGRAVKRAKFSFGTVLYEEEGENTTALAGGGGGAVDVDADGPGPCPACVWGAYYTRHYKPWEVHGEEG